MSALPAIPMEPGGPVDACERCGVEHDESRCNAHGRSGDQCGNAKGKGTIHLGYGLCRFHGGVSESGIKHAEAERQRTMLAILNAGPRCFAELYRIVEDDTASDRDRFLAAKDLLDRGGVGVPNRMEITGPDGGPVSVEVRAAQLSARLAAIEAGVVIEGRLAEVVDPVTDEE